MSFLFTGFPSVNYSFKKNSNFELLTDISLRFKIRDAVKNRFVVHYDYLVQDEDRPDTIADRFFGDPRLDWIIFLSNDIIDPYYDWPLNNDNFNSYMVSLYGSVSTAQTTVYEYRQILNDQSVTFDNIIVPKRTIVVDLNTYNSLVASQREIIYAYDYYLEQNDNKRKIKILDARYVSQIVSEAENIFSS
jgi:hypothetical protein